MTRIIFVRHGESYGNLEHRFYGSYDKGLTETGKQQASLAGDYILKNYKLDAAYASDLGRAFETGKIIAQKQGLTPIPEKGLREIYAGKWENRLYDELTAEYSESYMQWRNDVWNAHPDGGETVKQLCERIKKTVWEISKSNDGKTVLIATHATPIRSLVCEWQGQPYENMKQNSWVGNAAVSVIDYDNQKGRVNPIIIGEASFLGDIRTELPKNV